MRVTKYITDFAKDVIASRTAQIFFFIHLAFLIAALIKRGSLFQPFHAEYEPMILNILAVINAPVSVITVILLLPVALLLTAFDLEKNQSISNFLVVFMYVGWQTQAALVGYGIEKLFRRRKEKLS
jgi:hypothetical protein